jgi:hypothetical protein
VTIPYRKLSVTLTIDTSAPDDRVLSVAVAEALDKVLRIEDVRNGAGLPGQRYSYQISGAFGLTKVTIRHTWRNSYCGLPDWLFDRLPCWLSEWVIRRAA